MGLRKMDLRMDLKKMEPEKMESEKIRVLASLVLERLNEKRVGFLWPAAPVFLERQEGFRWIHYCRRAFVPTEPAPRGQVISFLEEWEKPEGFNEDEEEGKLKTPLSEGRTLDLLAVPAGNAGVLCEVASGMTVSPESSLIEGALRASIPVLFDVSPFDAWLRSPSSKRGRACGRVLTTLSQRGMEFIGLSKVKVKVQIPLSHEDQHQPLATAAPGTWFSWPEIAPFARGPVLRIARGAKLTPEASDRLAQLNIRVEEI
jgi:hypothetical protein